MNFKINEKRKKKGKDKKNIKKQQQNFKIILTYILLSCNFDI